jgi:hypothetical protein
LLDDAAPGVVEPVGQDRDDQFEQRRLEHGEVLGPSSAARLVVDNVPAPPLDEADILPGHAREGARAVVLHDRRALAIEEEPDAGPVGE